MIKKVKKDASSKQSKIELLKSIEKFQQLNRKAAAGEPNTAGQVSASDSSSIMQTIVSINRHPYYAREVVSDQNTEIQSKSTD